MPVRVGTPTGFAGLVDVVNSPVYATSTGLIHYGVRSHRQGNVQELQGRNLFDKIFSRMKGWAEEFLAKKEDNMGLIEFDQESEYSACIKVVELAVEVPMPSTQWSGRTFRAWSSSSPIQMCNRWKHRRARTNYNWVQIPQKV